MLCAARGAFVYASHEISERLTPTGKAALEFFSELEQKGKNIRFECILLLENSVCALSLELRASPRTRTFQQHREYERIKHNYHLRPLMCPRTCPLFCLGIAATLPGGAFPVAHRMHSFMGRLLWIFCINNQRTTSYFILSVRQRGSSNSMKPYHQ